MMDISPTSETRRLVGSTGIHPMASLDDLSNLHLQVGGLVLGCGEPVCDFVFAFDTPVLL